MKAILLYWRNQIPNCLKVVIILEELGLPYESKWVELQDFKQEPYHSANPCGNVPAIHDLNTDVILFGSSTIMSYLISTYDNALSLTFAPSSPLIHKITQWSYFQASCQGPYFHQLAWFHSFHADKLPSVQSRYAQEILHVVSGLDNALKEKEWLVSNKCTWADLAFVPWNLQIGYLMKGYEGEKKWDKEAFPAFKNWQERMLSRVGVRRAIAKMKTTMATNERGNLKRMRED